MPKKKPQIFEERLNNAEYLLNQGMLSDSQPIDEELDYSIKLSFSRKFSQKYLNVMSFLFSLIIIKRVALEPMTQPQNLHRLFFHLLVIALTLLILKVHKTRNLATRITPYLICILSFVGHTRYLGFNTIFNPNLPRQEKYQTKI